MLPGGGARPAWRQASEHQRRRPTAVKPAPHCPHTVVAVSLRTPVAGRCGLGSVVAVSLRTLVTGCPVCVGVAGGAW